MTSIVGLSRDFYHETKDLWHTAHLFFSSIFFGYLGVLLGSLVTFHNSCQCEGGTDLFGASVGPAGLKCSCAH